MSLTYCISDQALLRFPHVVAYTRSSTVPFPLLRLACRDIGGSDPERMAAPRVADYVVELFKDSPVQVGSKKYASKQSWS